MSTPRTPRGPQLVREGSNPVAASADGRTKNTLGINMVRLPIGHEAEDPRPAGPRTMFWLVIPTNTGGRLICEHKGGGILTLLAHDGRTDIGGVPKLLLDIVIHPKSKGVMYVAADEGTPRKVTARFEQVGIAREGASQKDAPLIPWNFWYFPSARKFSGGEVNADAGVAEAIIRKYIHAVTTEPRAATTLADKAAKWEHDNHGADVGPSWLGHCHNAAGASIVFEQPVAKTVNGQSFTEDELELIATELFGNLGSGRVAFALRGTAPGMGPPRMFSKSAPEGLPFESVADEAREARPVFTKGFDHLFYPMCFKPSEAKSPNVGMLERALRGFDPTMGREANALAIRAFASMDIPKLVREWYSELAAQFYNALVECILKGKHALEGDLASLDPAAGPEEVWNHAVFHYKAVFSETNYHNDPAKDNNDPLDVTLTIDLTANDDGRLPIVDPITGNVTMSSAGAPARPTRDGGVDLSKANQRRSQQVLRLIFDRAGEITFDDRNDWIASKNADLENRNRPGKAHVSSDTHAPRYLAWMALDFGAERRVLAPDLPPLARGNIAVQLEALSGPAPLLALRRRFQP